MNIGRVTTQMIEAYLDKMKVTGRTRFNVWRHIRALANFAVRRRYLSRESRDDIFGIERPTMEHGEIEVFSPVGGDSETVEEKTAVK